ncbi:MAG: hypothetical protein ABW110_23155 [Steroidobacteraceae bacterium]
MSGTCEVIGWLLDETGSTRRVVREENGTTSFENVCSDSSIGTVAVQTGTFRRGKAIVDPITQECLGYELERVPNRFAHI